MTGEFVFIDIRFIENRTERFKILAFYADSIILEGPRFQCDCFSVTSTYLHDCMSIRWVNPGKIYVYAQTQSLILSKMISRSSCGRANSVMDSHTTGP